MLAPMSQRNGSVMSGRPIAGSSSRDDLSTHRYQLTQPEGLAPLCEDKLASGDCKCSSSCFLSVCSNFSNHPDIYPDFFPWKRTREEDNLATQNLQKGYNPSPYVHNEALAARSAMLSLFKQRSSFYALSYFMLGAMEVKEQCNRITSNSTFKPPPRVTLTEQKKEAWLRDLATPSVPLRRLSRTIPHGTRNRSLLEQCTNKNIPIPRAVWFARCVGANELRGLKRKGSSQAGPVTEAQWVHEWTDQVTEFIEKVIKECAGNTATNNSAIPPPSPTTASSASSPNPSHQQKGKSAPKPYNSPSTNKLTSYHPTQLPWKSRMEYIIRLSASLFNEGLLDKPLFLRWTVLHFQRCKLDELPVALLFLRLFWNNIVQSRVLSQNLALALLERFAEISAPNLIKNSIFASVRDKVCEYLQSFFLLSPDSFVIPNHWKEVGHVLAEALKNIDNDVAHQLLELICTRNESLIVTDASSVRALRNPKYLVIDALDKAQAPYNWVSLNQSIHANKISEQDALSTALEWATKNHRTGIERVYICSSLLSEWHTSQKWNISEAFLSFLDQIGNPDDYVMENLYDLMTEFLDRDWFQASTYFRRIISHGSLFIKRSNPSVQVQINVLANIPVRYSSSLRNQQIMLLKGLGAYNDREEERLKKVKAILLNKLDFLSSDPKTGTEYYEISKEDCECIGALTKGGEAELSSWILNSLDKQLRCGLEVTVSQFAILQNVLELLRDYKGLYFLIEAMVSQTSNGNLLYFMANTTRDHLAIFAAIADVLQLVQLFVTQYKTVKVKAKKSNGLWDLTHFALSHLPESNTQLRTELEQIAFPSGQSPLKDITTLSPVSDIVNEGTIINQELSEFFQEQFGSQDNIDTRTLPKLFAFVSQKFLNACKVSDNYEELRKVVNILQRLRDIDSNMFGDLLTKWIKDQVEPALYYDSNAFTRFLLFLVVYECLTLEKAADIFLQLLSVKLPGSTEGTKLMLSLIAEDYLVGIQLKASEKLVLNMHRRQFERNHAATYLKYIFQDIMDSANDSGTEQLYPSVLEFLLWLSSSDLNLFISNFVDPIIETNSAAARNILRTILINLLKLNPPFQNPKQEILHVLELFSPFNLPLSQVYVRVVLGCYGDSLTATSSNGISIEDSILGTLLEVITGAQASNLNERAVGDLMVYLPSNIKSKLAEKCELLFVSSSHFPCVVNMDTGKGNILPYLLEIIDAVADSGTANLFENNAFEVTQSLDKLALACEKQAKPSDVADDTLKDVEMADEFAIPDKDLRTAILLFVKLIMIHSPQLSNIKGHESLRDRLTSGLVRILGTPFVGANADLYGLLMDTSNTIKGDNVIDDPSRPGTAATSSSVVSQSDVAGPGSILSAISPAALAATASQYGLLSGTVGQRVDDNESAYLADLIMYNKATNKYSALAVRNFDLLEEGNHTMAVNDVAVNLAMFDGIIERKNPV